MMFSTMDEIDLSDGVAVQSNDLGREFWLAVSLF